MSAQYKEADRSLLGIGDLSLPPAQSKFQLTVRVWKTMSDRQRQHAVDAYFRLLLLTETSLSTDDGSLVSNLHVMYRFCAGKKINQRKRPRAEHTQAAGPGDGQVVTDVFL